MMLGADMVLHTVDDIITDRVKPIPQDRLLTAGEEPTPAPKIFTDTCRIDWSLPAERVYNLVRGLSPYPSAWTTLRNADGKALKLKIFVTGQPLEAHNNRPGTLSVEKKRLYIACVDRMIEIKELQLEGKRRMTADAFLLGYDMNNATVE